MFKVILALSMSSLLLVSVANAQPKGGMMVAAEELGLTDDQIDKLADLQFEHQKAMIQKRAALQDAELELRQIMREAKVDKKAALAIQERISAVKADMARVRLDHRLEMRKVLSAEQLDKWMKMRRHDMRQGMRHNKGERGHPGMKPRQGGNPGRGMGPGPDPDPWD
jgi:Spy/CpxP family protein refolding chaperone